MSLDEYQRWTSELAAHTPVVCSCSSTASLQGLTYGQNVLGLSAVLIAAVSNLDNLAAGVAFRIRDIRIAGAPETR